MNIKNPEQAQIIMNDRFGHDTLIALATVDGGIPYVRAVNAYYKNGKFYILTHACSQKMKQIARNPIVALTGEWFTAHGRGADMGYILAPENSELIAELKNVFASWYYNGHIDEADENTHILCIHLTDGVLMSHGTQYDLIFDK